MVQPTPFNSQISPNPNDTSKTEDASAEKKPTADNIKIFLWELFLALIYGAIGFYLLKDGRLFYFLLMKEDSVSSREAEPEVTTLNL